MIEKYRDGTILGWNPTRMETYRDETIAGWDCQDGTKLGWHHILP
jgi:hypothetical protein